MRVYFDITLLPSDDIGHHFLWEKVYQQVHLALVENQNGEEESLIGVGFPEFNEEKHRLGRKLRVFAPSLAALNALDIQRWLDRLRDYVHITSVRDVSGTVDRYERFSRLQVKSNPERIARRAAKRSGMDYQQALDDRKSVASVRTRAPYIWMKSLSGGSRFRLFIKRDECSSVEGGFSAYGLSKGGALPLI